MNYSGLPLPTSSPYRLKLLQNKMLKHKIIGIWGPMQETLLNLPFDTSQMLTKCIEKATFSISKDQASSNLVSFTI